MDLAKKYFGARIKELREYNGLNQEQLAEKINMESRHLSRIETGKSFTTLENIIKIANALNVEVNELFIFEHKKDRKILIKNINNYLENAKDNEIEIVYRLIKTLFL